MLTLGRYDAVRNKLLQALGERKGLYRAKREAKIKMLESSTAMENAKKARAFLQLVAQRTQQELEFRVGSLGTLALKAVFPDDPYKIVLRFEQKRGRTEAALRFTREKDSMEIKPIDASGGGAVLVAAFALRLTFWKISHKPTAPVMFLDEPFHFLSKDLMEKASEVLREIAKKLDVQIIMVTHEEELLAGVDRAFVVRKKKGISYAQRS
jgi:DNA repair exonuclease SbcCD ATPase subunit